MDLVAVCNILREDDGSLPEVEIQFNGASVVAQAYALVQSRALAVKSKMGHYWSKNRQADCAIAFGENPAKLFLADDAEPFHVVFGGIRSSDGTEVPMLGFFVIGADYVSLDFRMGPEWSANAVIGFFELVRDLSQLASCVSIRHTCNIFDPDGQIFMSSYEAWISTNNSIQPMPPARPISNR
jgi:hypothetical protein